MENIEYPLKYTMGDRVRIVGNWTRWDKTGCPHFYPIGEVVEVCSVDLVTGALRCANREGHVQLVYPQYVEKA